MSKCKNCERLLEALIAAHQEILLVLEGDYIVMGRPATILETARMHLAQALTQPPEECETHSMPSGTYRVVDGELRQIVPDADSAWMLKALMEVMNTKCTCHEESETGGVDGLCPSCKASRLIAKCARRNPHNTREVSND